MKRVTVYYKENSKVSLQVINWLNVHHLTVELKKIETITHREIFQLIYLSGLDIPDILSTSVCPYHVQKKKDFVTRLYFSESLYFLARYPELLKVPIILSNTTSISGYDEQMLEKLLLELPE